MNFVIFFTFSRILLKSLIIYYYIEIYSKYAIIKLENTLINWLIALIAVDFLFYWFHRASHGKLG